MNHIIFFIKNQINQTGFKIGFAVLVLLSTGGIVMGYIKNYQSDLIFLRSAADNFLLTSTDCRIIRMLFVFCFPLIAASLCTENRKSNSLFPMLRMNKRQYIYGNALASVSMTIISFMVVLGLNQLLCFVAFPLSGADNRWGLPEYDLINSFHKELLFDIWTVQNPYIYNVFYIIIISIMAGGIALLTYGLRYIKKLERFKPVQLSVLVFVVFTILFVVSELLHIPIVNFMAYIEPGHAVRLVQYVIFTLCIYAVGLFLTIRGQKKYEYI